MPALRTILLNKFILHFVFSCQMCPHYSLLLAYINIIILLSYDNFFFISWTATSAAANSRNPLHMQISESTVRAGGMMNPRLSPMSNAAATLDWDLKGVGGLNSTRKSWNTTTFGRVDLGRRSQLPRNRPPFQPPAQLE